MHASTAIELEPGEQIVLYLRPFWLTMFGPLLAASLFYAIPTVLVIIFWSIVHGWLANPLLGPIITIALSIYTATVWLFTFGKFVDFYLNTWVVTTMRIIDADQIGLFGRSVSELHLANIQDVTTKVNGVIQTVFNYGDLMAETAAEQEHFNFYNAPHPEHIKEVIMRLVEAEKDKIRVVQNPAA